MCTTSNWTHPRHRISLLTWLSELGYRADPVPIPIGDLPLWALEEESRDALALTYAGCHDADASFKILLAEHSAPRSCGELLAWQSRWAGRLWRRNRTFRGILITAGAGYDDILLTLVYPAGRIHRPGLRHIRLEQGAMRTADLERVRRLAIGGRDVDGHELIERLRDDLDINVVTREFFRRFRAAHRSVADGLTGVGDASFAHRSALGLTILTRLLFLYFLQRKGLLDANRRYLSDARAKTDKNVYATLLTPLFFEVLNTPVEGRSELARSLGRVPYLNGGLFERTDLERRCPDIDLPDRVIGPVFDDLLERYAFTTASADGEGVGVNPAMLGRVFEALMASEERGASGTFYTPRVLVDAAVADALTEVMLRHGATRSQARCLLAEEEVMMPDAVAERLRLGLERATFLDPACGSGAFLLGTLEALERIHQTLAASLRQVPEPVASIRRQIVARNLYGVDLNPAAIRVCELRLWLAILDGEEGDDVAPLPNLNHRVRRGNVLLEPVDWTCALEDLGEVSEHVEELEDLKREYACVAAPHKEPIRQVVEIAEIELYRRLLVREVERSERHHEALRQIALAPDLFGVPARPSRAAQSELTRVKTRLDELRAKIVGIDTEGRCPGFSPAVHFPEVTAAGGFDAVVTNPPWVRVHGIAAGERAQLRRRYEVARSSAWTAGGMLADIKGFGSQVDLSACFVERSHELLRPDGTLAMVLPSKLTRALYGGGVRRLLTSRCTPVKVVEIDENLFPDATTYPCLIVANKGSCRSSSMLTVGTDASGEGARIRVGDLSIHPGDVAAPWIVGPRRSKGIVELMQRGLALGEHPALTLSRGVVTGFNEAFVLAADEVLGSDLEPHTLPVVRGGDIGPFAWGTRDRIVWTHGRDAQPLTSLPTALAAHLEPHRKRLLARADLRRNHAWWRLFRATPSLFGPKVAWRDMGKRLEAVALPAEDDEGRPIIALNTVYYLPVANWEQALVLAAWMNSSVVREMAGAVAERAAGGYLRFFSWVLALLPLPATLAEALHTPGTWRAALATDPVMQLLLESAVQLHANPPGRGEATPKLDDLVNSLYLSEGRDKRRGRLVS